MCVCTVCVRKRDSTIKKKSSQKKLNQINAQHTTHNIDPDFEFLSFLHNENHFFTVKIMKYRNGRVGGGVCWEERG